MSNKNLKKIFFVANWRKLLNKNGLVFYMFCSFLDNETINQINNFIYNHKEFKIFNFKKIDNNSEYLKLFNKNFISTLPDTILNHKIDGYFAAYLEKIV